MSVLDALVRRLPGSIGVRDGRGWSVGVTPSATLPICEAAREGEERRHTGSGGTASAKVRCNWTGAAFAWEENSLSAHTHAAPAATQSATIAAGAVTVSGPSVRLLTVDTEAAAASDDLVTISGGTAGQLLVVRAANSARTVVVLETGNIDRSTAGSMSLDNAADTTTLVYTGSTWLEVSRSNNDT